MNLPPEISNLLTGQRLIENALGLNKPQPTKPMIESLKIDSPTEEGYYTAKRKTWAVGSQLTIVRVARPGTAGEFRVYQCGDEMPSSVDQWDWSERIYI
jgi:hypothetical protein